VEGDVPTGIVATPFMVHQIHSNGGTQVHYNSPSVCPTSDFSRPFLLLRGFLEVFADGCLSGTRCFVNCLPMRLLAFLGLYVGTNVWEEVQRKCLEMPCGWGDLHSRSRPWDNGA